MPNLIVQELIKKFAENPELKEKCLKTAEEALKEDYKLSRLFDDFPCMLPDPNMQALNNLLKDFLLDAKPSDAGDGHYVFQQKMDKETVRHFENLIAQIACDELLDEKGNIQQEIAELLEWKEPLSQKQVCAVMNSFLAYLNHETLKLCKETIEKRQKSYLAFCNYVNANKTEIIRSKMVQNEKVFDLTELNRIDWSKFAEVFFSEKNVKRAGVILALSMAGLLLFEGYRLMTGQRDSSENQNNAHGSGGVNPGLPQ